VFFHAARRNVRCNQGFDERLHRCDKPLPVWDVLVFLRETFFRCWNEFKRAAHSPDKTSYYRGLAAAQF
jgi:hypothetical protein